MMYCTFLPVVSIFYLWPDDGGPLPKHVAVEQRHSSVRLDHITVTEYFKRNGFNPVKLISINASPCRQNRMDFTSIVARFLLTGRVFVTKFSGQAFSCNCNTLCNFMHQYEAEQADII